MASASRPAPQQRSERAAPARAAPAKAVRVAKAGKVANPVIRGNPGGEPAARVLRRFRVVFNAVRTHFSQVEKTTGVGGASLWALGLVQAHPDMGMTLLAQAMDVHQTTASNLVKQLVARGLVATARDGPDRRAVTLRTTPAGARLLRRAPGPFTGLLPEALAALDPRVLSRLDRDLGLLIGALGTDERAANIPLSLPLRELERRPRQP